MSLALKKCQGFQYFQLICHRPFILVLINKHKSLIMIHSHSSNTRFIERCLLASVFFCFFTEAKAMSNDEVKKYIENAIDFTYFSNFKSEKLKILFHEKTIEMVFYNLAYNNKDYYARYERKWNGNQGTAVYVKNPEGCFFWRENNNGVISNTIIKSQLPINAFKGLTALKIYHLVPSTPQLQPKYSVRTSTHNGTPCYKILIKYPVSDESISHLSLGKISLADLRSYDKFQKDSLRAKTSSTFELAVGLKNFPFVYFYNCYNVSGQIIESVDFGHPQLLKLNKAFFKVPEEASIETTRNMDEFKKIATDKYSPPGGFRLFTLTCCSGISEILEYIGLFMLNHGSKITLAISIIAAGGAITLKVKSRQIR